MFSDKLDFKPHQYIISVNIQRQKYVCHGTALTMSGEIPYKCHYTQTLTLLENQLWHMLGKYTHLHIHTVYN